MRPEDYWRKKKGEPHRQGLKRIPRPDRLLQEIKGYGSLANPKHQWRKTISLRWKTREGVPEPQGHHDNSPCPCIAKLFSAIYPGDRCQHKGIGTMLMHNDRSIAFLSKILSPKHQSFSIYEKEILAILMAITKNYLKMSPFIIRTDQQSIKHQEIYMVI